MIAAKGRCRKRTCRAFTTTLTYFLSQKALRKLMDPAIVAACLSWQLLPAVIVNVGIGVFHVGQRTGGSITGSRTAGAMGRVPVEESLRFNEAVLVNHA